MLARFVKLGERYGLGGCLTHPARSDCLKEPMVEFYGALRKPDSPGDLAWEGNKGWWFVSRYYLPTFMGTGEYGFGRSPLQGGICLAGAIPEYNLSGEMCRKVAAWIESLDQGEGNDPA